MLKFMPKIKQKVVALTDQRSVVNLKWQLLAIGVVLLLLPEILPSTYWVRVAGIAGLYVILTLGLNIIVGYAGLLDLGYVAFYGIGGYTYALLASPHFNLHYSFWLVLPLSMALAGLAGVALGAPTLRLRGDYLAIVTLGFGEIVRLLLLNLDEPINITNGPNGIVRVDPPSIGSFSFTSVTSFYYLILAMAVVAVVITFRAERSRVGRAWMAIREDETVAKSMGVNTTLYKLTAFAMGAMYAGAAGALLAAWQGAIFPATFTMQELVTIFCMLVLGGTGSIMGVIAGSSLLVVIPEIMRGLDLYRMIIYGLVLVLMMRFRPQGLFATRATSTFQNVGMHPAKMLPSSAHTPVVPAPKETTQTMLQSAGSVQSATTTASTPTLPAQREVSEPHRMYLKPRKQLRVMPNTPCLELQGVSKSFGGLKAVNNVSFTVQPGEIVSIIGPNGAGKTTLFNLITGIYKPDQGKIWFFGKDITGMPQHIMAETGLARTFQTIRLFKNMTVLENVMVGGHSTLKAGLLASIIKPRYVKEEEERCEAEARACLSFFGRELDDRRNELGINLPYAHQRRIEIARALASYPQLLLLDEPAAGMNPAEARELVELIRKLRNFGYTVLLVEHHMHVVMNISDKIIVLDHGEKIAEGSPDEILQNQKLVEAYLGKSASYQSPVPRITTFDRSTAKKQEISTQPCSNQTLQGQKPESHSAASSGKPYPNQTTQGRKPILELKNVNAFYGPIQALHNINIKVYEGEAVCILGANGAGKTTCLRTIMGSGPQISGQITFNGHQIDRLPTAQIVKLGVGIVPEGRRVFSRLTVRENLELGGFTRSPSEIKKTMEEVLTIFPHLGDRLNQKAGTLSGGEQQMLAISRALMMHPKLLCLDEPSMGLAPVLVESLFEQISKIKSTGTTILMVEQNAAMALAVADRGYVLQTGFVVLEGSTQELSTSTAVQEAYLGGPTQT